MKNTINLTQIIITNIDSLLKEKNIKVGSFEKKLVLHQAIYQEYEMENIILHLICFVKYLMLLMSRLIIYQQTLMKSPLMKKNL